MNQETLLGWYEKLEKLIGKLPGPLQKAILTEFQPVKELFLEQRSPRILLLGTSQVARMEIVNSLFREQVLALPEDSSLPVVPGWETFRRRDGGSVLLLDARGLSSINWSSGRELLAPDLILFACQKSVSNEELQPEIDLLAQALVETEGTFAKRPTVFGVVENADKKTGRARTVEESELEASLRNNVTINKSLAQVCTIQRWSRFRADGTPDEGSPESDGLHQFLTMLVDELPTQAKLEMARISGVRPAQKKIADSLIKATAAVTAVIGAQPIPLADMPILTGLQSSMVAGIIYISGGDMNLRSALKFLGSLGVTIGMGIVLREASRSIAKLVPGFGSIVSGAVAAGGTLAIGRSAQAFFIDGLSLTETRKIFRRKTKKETPEIASGDL